MFGRSIRIVKYYFMAQPIALPADGAERRHGSFTLEYVGPDCTLFEQVDRPREIIEARFAQGARCLAATDRDARLAGFLWLLVGPYDEDEVRARFVPEPSGRAAWDFDVVVMPRYRMGRLFSYLWNRACVDLQHQGIAHSLSRISAFNGPSLASHRRLGSRRVGRALFVCIGNVQFMSSSLPPRWHLSWRESQRPVLAIRA